MTEEMLGGRYRLEERIGQGGMAEVYAAQDTVLERRVAVKILLARFREEPKFLERFRQEAQNAASLNHPSITAVYDTGEEQGLPYIVMELVRGRSLADAIRAGGLTEERALEVCAEACSALQYAHDRGLVHRDVKPGNILLGENGTVKVTDFGIARAAAAENVTRTASVLGTAAYLSPEQAQGLAVDARSDVYALGVVLYEVLTGAKPFDADSAITVAYQHVQEQPLPPRDVDPSISPAAEAIAMRALAKNPANRYQSTSAMRQDLLSARVGEKIAAPAVMRPDETALLDPVGEERPVPTERSEQRRRTVGYVLLGLLTLAATAGIVLLLGAVLSDQDAPTVEVPNVTGQTISVATRTLEAQGLNAQVIDEVYSDDVPAGQVARQDPSQGTRVDRGLTVRLYESRGREPVAVPEIVGLPEEDAVAELRAADLRIGERSTEFSDEHEPGIVLAAEPPPGETVTTGEEVDLTISAGRETVRVPPVEARPEADARFALEDRGLTPLVVREFSDVVAEGVVIRQNPDPGEEIPKGAEVTIVVSKGPAEEPSPSPSPSPSPEPSPEPSPTPTEPSPTPSPEATQTAVAPPGDVRAG